MRYLTRKSVVIGCAGLASLLVCLSIIWIFRPLVSSVTPDRLQVGVTTEAEVDAMFGPPIQGKTRVLTPEQARSRGLPARPDGEPITITEKLWWYDDDHIIELEIDERGIVICCRGPGAGGHSPLNQRRRRLRELFE